MIIMMTRRRKWDMGLGSRRMMKDGNSVEYNDNEKMKMMARIMAR